MLSSGFGWFRVISGSFGWLRVVSGGFGWFRVVPCFSMYGLNLQFSLFMSVFVETQKKHCDFLLGL